jgi:hypothetical protein
MPPNNSLEPTRRAGSNLMVNRPATCHRMGVLGTLPPSGSPQRTRDFAARGR